MYTCSLSLPPHLLGVGDGYASAALLACSRLACPRPSPPAPEGWDKDINLNNITQHGKLHHHQDYHQYLETSAVFMCINLISLLHHLLLLLHSLFPMVVFLLVLVLGLSRPSPPAPEGWDKDINTINTSHEYTPTGTVP